MSIRSLSSAYRELMARSVPTATERQAAARHRGSVTTALAALDPYGLYETGSFRHGTAVRGNCDVDVLVSLQGPRPTDAGTALTRVRSALVNSFPSTPVRINRPAVVVSFAQGNEKWEVIPAYIEDIRDGFGVYSIPDPKGNGWIQSSPAAHLDYVNIRNQSPEGGAKSLARLMKAYKYANRQTFRVSSFYLEMQAARYMETESIFLPDVDFRYLMRQLVLGDLASMSDPMNVMTTINATATEAYRVAAATLLKNDLDRTERAEDAELAGNSAEAFGLMNTVFLNRFPSRIY